MVGKGKRGHARSRDLRLSMSKYRCDGESCCIGLVTVTRPHGNLAMVQDSWPPMPDENYRRAHYVVSEWLDKVSILSLCSALSAFTKTRSLLPSAENQHKPLYAEPT